LRWTALPAEGEIADRDAAPPFLSTLPLAAHGLRLVDPPLPPAHPLDDGTAVCLGRLVDATAAGLGGDGAAWQRLIGRVARDWPRLAGALLGPRLPRHPLDVTPRQLLAIAGDRLPPGYRRRLACYRYGFAAFKVDGALEPRGRGRSGGQGSGG
jgi:phytoene dehydrogenase-like protein